MKSTEEYWLSLQWLWAQAVLTEAEALQSWQQAISLCQSEHAQNKGFNFGAASFRGGEIEYHIQETTTEKI